MAAGSGGIRAGKAFIFIEAVDRTARMFKRIGMKFQAFGQRISAMGRNLIAKGLLSLTPTALSIKVFASFDDAMKKVEARSGATASEIKMLRDQAKKLGRETSNTATEIGNLQAKLAQKGFAPTQILSMTAAVRNLARAAGEGDIGDVVVAADLVSGTLRAFRKDASQAGPVADLFTAAVNNSNFSLQGLVDAMSKAGPTAAVFGVSIEDTVATLAGMTNVNIEATAAGTAFRNLLLKLSDATKRSGFNAELKKMTGGTIKFIDEMGNLRPLPRLMFELGEATKDLGTAQKGELFSDLFGLRTFVGAATISSGRKEFIKMQKTLNDVTGTAARTAAKMESGVGGAFRRFNSAVTGAAIEIGEVLAPALNKLTDFFTVNIGKVTEWIQNNKETIVTVTALSVGVVALGVALVGLGIALKIVGIAFSIVGGAFLLFKGLLLLVLSPLGLIIGLLAAVIAIVIKFSDTFRNALGKVTNFIGEKFSGLAETLTKTFRGVIKALTSGNFQAAWDILVEGLQLSWLQFVDIITTAWNRFTNFFISNWLAAIEGIRIGILKVQKFIAGIAIEATDIGGASRAQSTRAEKARLAGIERAKKERVPELQADIKRAKEARTAILKTLEQRGVDVENLLQRLKDKAEADVAGEVFGFVPGTRGGEELFKGVEGLASQVGKQGLQQLRSGFEDLLGSGKITETQLKSLRDFSSEIKGAGIEIADIFGRDTEFQDTFDDARQAMLEGFEVDIQNVREEAAKSFGTRDKEIQEESDARQKEIQERKDRLNALLENINKEITEEEEPEITDDTGDKLNTLLDKASGIADVIPAMALEGLEKGSIQAIQQFQKNLQNQPLDDLVETSKDQLEVLESIDAKTGAAGAVILEA